MTMSQSVQPAQEQSKYYDSNNTPSFAGMGADAESSGGLSLLNSQAVWALGLLLSFALGRFTQSQKLPAGFKKLPKVPGKPPAMSLPWPSEHI